MLRELPAHQSPRHPGERPPAHHSGHLQAGREVSPRHGGLDRARSHWISHNPQLLPRLLLKMETENLDIILFYVFCAFNYFKSVFIIY